MIFIMHSKFQMDVRTTLLCPDESAGDGTVLLRYVLFRSRPTPFRADRYQIQVGAQNLIRINSGVVAPVDLSCKGIHGYRVQVYGRIAEGNLGAGGYTQR